MPWLHRLVSEKTANRDAGENLNPPQPRSHGKRRPKVWLVPSDEAVVEQMMDLLADFGTLPPEPTAMFPCDSTTTAAAVSEMVWRLRRAADILDETGQENMQDETGKEKIAKRLQAVFLCPDIIVVTHPETLSPQDQTNLIGGIGELTSDFSNRSFSFRNTDVRKHDRAICKGGVSS